MTPDLHLYDMRNRYCWARDVLALVDEVERLRAEVGAQRFVINDQATRLATAIATATENDDLNVWHIYEVVSDDEGISFSIDTLEHDALGRAAYWSRRPGLRVRKVRYEQPRTTATRTVIEDPIAIAGTWAQP